MHELQFLLFIRQNFLYLFRLLKTNVDFLSGFGLYFLFFSIFLMVKSDIDCRNNIDIRMKGGILLLILLQDGILCFLDNTVFLYLLHLHRGSARESAFFKGCRNGTDSGEALRERSGRKASLFFFLFFCVLFCLFLLRRSRAFRNAALPCFYLRRRSFFPFRSSASLLLRSFSGGSACRFFPVDASRQFPCTFLRIGNCLYIPDKHQKSEEISHSPLDDAGFLPLSVLSS